MEYSSDERKKFIYEIEASTGGFYNGELHQAELELNYRQQPWGNFGLAIEYNRLEYYFTIEQNRDRIGIE